MREVLDFFPIANIFSEYLYENTGQTTEVIQAQESTLCNINTGSVDEFIYLDEDDRKGIAGGCGQQENMRIRISNTEKQDKFEINDEKNSRLQICSDKGKFFPSLSTFHLCIM